MTKRRFIIAAVVIMATASSFAQGIKTKADSLSYAAGMSMTDGLIPFLRQNLDVDTAYMADFVSGLKEAIGKQDDPKFKAHAAGYQIAQMLQSRMLPQVETDFKETQQSVDHNLFIQGFTAALMGDGSVFTTEAAQEYFKRQRDAAKAAQNEKLYGENRRAGEQFLAENAKKKDVKVLPSGLQYKVLTKGTGDVATISDQVVVKYEGKLVDGTIFDSSYERKEQTNKFRPGDVIKGWTEALTLMPAGSKWQLFIPYQLAYGERQAGKIKPYSALIFTVEVVSVEKSN